MTSDTRDIKQAMCYILILQILLYKIDFSKVRCGRIQERELNEFDWACIYLYFLREEFLMERRGWFFILIMHKSSDTPFKETKNVVAVNLNLLRDVI